MTRPEEGSALIFVARQTPEPWHTFSSCLAFGAMGHTFNRVAVANSSEVRSAITSHAESNDLPCLAVK
jgi:hypothetical protein